jgi:hypothetical protein
MKKTLTTLFVVLTSYLFGQGFTYSYVDPCSRQVKTLQITNNQAITVNYLGNINSFSSNDFVNGAFDNWVNQITAATTNQPCDELLTNTQVSQNMFITQNLISTLTSITAASTMTASNAVSNSVSNSNSSEKSKRGGNSNTNNSSPNNQSNTSTNGASNNSQGNLSTTQQLRVAELNKEEMYRVVLQLLEEIIHKEEQLTNQITFLRGEVERLSSL